ncbi:MAG: Fic family protein [Sphingobacteriaceae bacterium]|nr:Fic family protein [Sphingobacteriaceae bacterium]
MENFDEYLRQGEPNKAEKAKVWKTAIGLQQVDGLTPSAYLIETARQNIEGDITFEEVKARIEQYYQQHAALAADDRTEEADKVSARIAEILSEQTFTFSPAAYLNIHKRLFADIYPFAGMVRDYNITKKEWVLNGETVLYASAGLLQEILAFEIEQEKKFSYKRLSEQEIIAHLASFVSNLWQIHLFGEGNTRTTAIFLIQYLRKLGFKNANNNLFANHSWYFRNALVRANYEDLSRGIYRTEQFLIRFLSNLLLETNYPLQNREMHIEAANQRTDPVNKPPDTVNALGDTVNDTVSTPLLALIQQNNRVTALEMSARLGWSLSTVKRKIKELKSSGKLERLGSDKNGYWSVK